MLRVAQAIIVLLTVFLIQCYCLPITEDEYRDLLGITEDEYRDMMEARMEERIERKDECPFKSAYPLYDEVSSVATSVLDPDYALLYNELFMRLGNDTTQVRYKNIRANLEGTPITIFSNLSLSRCKIDEYGYNNCHNYDVSSSYNTQPKLGEFISEKVVEAYSHFIKNSYRATPMDLSKIKPFSYDKSKWTSPWLKESLISGLVFVANSLEGLVGKQLTEEGKLLLQGNNLDNVLQVTGELANNALHSSLNLNTLKYFKQSILEELQRLPQKLSEKHIDEAVDCWYSTDGFYHIEEGAEDKILLLQAMIEVFPKDTLKEVFRSWRKSLEKQNDLEVTIDKILLVVDQKIQEFDMPRMINLFKDHMENMIEDMKLENVGGRNLFQRVEKLSKMIEKAMWRIQAGLWPEMINFMDRMVLTIKNVEKDGNGKSQFWKELDNLLSPTYRELKRQYKAVLLKELFPTSKKQLGSSDLWNHPYFRHLHGKLNPALYNLFANPQYNVLSEVLSYVKKMDVVEWEKWLENKLYWFIQSDIRSDLLRGGNSPAAYWLLKYTLAEMKSAGFTQLFLQDWEGFPRDLEDLGEMDLEAYFVYIIHTFLTN